MFWHITLFASNNFVLERTSTVLELGGHMPSSIHLRFSHRFVRGGRAAFVGSYYALLISENVTSAEVGIEEIRIQRGLGTQVGLWATQSLTRVLGLNND